MATPEPDPARESRPADLGSRGLLKLSDLPEYEDEDEALRKMDWRVRAWRQDSLTRWQVTVFYVAALLWLVFLIRIAASGESYSPMRNGGSAYATGLGLWVQCLAPVFAIAAIYFRLDQASLSVTNRRVWGFCFVLLAIGTYILAPYAFGTVTFLH